MPFSKKSCYGAFSIEFLKIGTHRQNYLNGSDGKTVSEEESSAKINLQYWRNTSQLISILMA